MTHLTKHHFIMPGIIFLMILSCLLSLTAPGSAGLVVPSEPPHSLSAANWNTITSQIQQQQYRVSAGDGGYRAHNLSQQWQTQFDETGFTVTPQVGKWTWGLTLTHYGLAGAEQPVRDLTAINARDNRVEYVRDPILTEWFINDTRGLEHGFTLHQRPDGEGEVLALTLQVHGSLHPQEQPDGRGVTFIDETGAAVIHYAGLMVFDAQGRDLPSNLRVENDMLRLVVNDRQAIYPVTIDPVAQQAFLKASDTYAGDIFGYAVAISGNTVVVGAPYEDGNATDSGAVYVYTRTGTTWAFQARLKAPSPAVNNEFGYAVAISGDTLVVGAPYRNSNTGIAYVFTRSGTTWTCRKNLTASNAVAGDQFGKAVAISGGTIVVGAPSKNSDAGAAYVFTGSGATWTQKAYLTISTGITDYFGSAVAISDTTAVVGAYGKDGSSGADAGAAYVYVFNGTEWVQQAALSPSNPDPGDYFGYSVAISGNTVVVGAYREDSNTKGVNTTPNNYGTDTGAAYVFTRSGTTWSQQAYLKASNTGNSDYFGYSVGISGDIIVVGAEEEDSNTTGIGSSPNDLSSNSGAAYVFTRSGTTWSQTSYLKAFNTGEEDRFGHAVAISDGTTVIGAYWEDSNTTGVTTIWNEIGIDSGAAYVFILLSDNSYLLWTK